MKKIFILLAIFGIMVFASNPAMAKGKNPCDLVGSWTGYADSPEYPAIVWSAVHTATDPSGKRGTMQINFVYVSPSLITWYGGYPNVTHLSPGNGIWEKTKKGQYKYTWYAYGMNTFEDDQTGLITTPHYPAYTIRVSGFVTSITDCNTVSIIYLYELFDYSSEEPFVSPQNMESKTPAHSTSGEAIEFRNPLTQLPPPPE